MFYVLSLSTVCINVRQLTTGGYDGYRYGLSFVAFHNFQFQNMIILCICMWTVNSCLLLVQF